MVTVITIFPKKCKINSFLNNISHIESQQHIFDNTNPKYQIGVKVNNVHINVDFFLYTISHGFLKRQVSTSFFVRWQYVLRLLPISVSLDYRS